MRIDSIIIGERHRKDMGDIAALARSIAEVGLLHPVVVNLDGVLIAGARRIAAFRLLGKEDIPATILDLDNIVNGEAAENVERKNFTLSESLAIWEAIESRQGRRSLPSDSDGSEPRKQASIRTGLSTDTLSKIKTVANAEKNEPGIFAGLGAMMEKKSVDAAYKEMRKRERAKASEEVDAAQGATPTTTLADVLEGDVWQLGRHILYCGDTSKERFRALLPHAALAFADPPYGAGVEGFDDSASYWEHDYLIRYADAVAVTPGIVSIFDFARKTAMPYQWSLATWITNGMTRGAIGFGNWIYTAVFAHGSLYKQAQDFSKATINPAQTGETAHKGRKPSEYMVWIIGLFTQADDVVIDPFLGSGQTLFACEKMHRQCVGGEIDPDFCRQIIERWGAMTGDKAERRDA